MLCLFTERHEQALGEVRRAIELNPNYADAHAHLANTLTFSGHTDDALAELDIAMRLNPHHPSFYLMMLGRTHFARADYRAAIGPLERAISVSPGFTPARTALTACYVATGRIDEARVLITETRTEVPQLSLAFAHAMTPFTDTDLRTRFLALLETAGVPA